MGGLNISKYKTEICTKDTIDELMAFLREKWSLNQMLSQDKAFADYTFYNKKTSAYNIIFARNVDTRQIAGFIAYVPASLFDGDIKEDFAWLTNWLVTEEAEGGLGISLFMKARSVAKCKCIGTVGQNKTAEKLYERMNFKIESLQHYYIVNQEIEGKIISNYKKPEAPATAEALPENKFKQLTYESLKKVTPYGFPYKTPEFIWSKYALNPYYKYYIYGVPCKGALLGAIVLKAVDHNKSRCLRIVEYFGNPIAIKDKRAELYNLLIEFNAEYMDFYCYGIDEQVLTKAGFTKKQGKVIIPNYFEPFVNQNIEIRFAYSFPEKSESLMVFKGDGDRDHKRFDTVSIL